MSSTPTRPNVLFIIADQHNAKVLGHQNHPDVHTPRLDALAKQGVRFDTAICQSPICTPSRVSFLSGQYGHNHGYYGLGGPRPHGLPSVLGHFRQAGYTTAAIGKIHCPAYWVEDDSDRFQEVDGTSIGGNPDYRQFLQQEGVLDAWQNGEKRKGIYGQSMDGFCLPLTYRQSPEGWSVTQAVEFMDEAQAAGQPFFAHVSFPRPHQVYAPSREFWEMYDENTLTLPPNAEGGGTHKAPHMLEMAQEYRKNLGWVEFEPRTYEAGYRRKLRGYLGNVSMVDHAVGELLDHLDQAGLAENTVVVYTADHGDYAGEHGLIEKAPGICSDAITRVPLLWRWPGQVPAGQRREQIAELVDVPATLCALAGLEPMQTADGQDLSAILKDPAAEPVHRVGVTEHAWSKSVRRGQYRYVYYPREMFAEPYPEGFGELYDLEADPWEMRNLYFEPEHRETVARMHAELTDWLITTTRPVTTNCAHQPSGWQALRRWGCSVNADGKIHPDNLRGLRNRNYV
ncbi:MAG: sulfatase-like hydrolase/transferase [Phycisphaeraceae bacterium]